MLAHWYISLFQTGDTPQPPVVASLGAWGKLPDKKREQEFSPEVKEDIPVQVISRIRDEMLSASLAADVIERARKQAQQRKNQHIAILLTL